MSGRVALVNPARHFIANKNGLGYLAPLGLILLGGPLIDRGFKVRLFDHDHSDWTLDQLIGELMEFEANYLLIGHSGSTASHKVVIETIRAVRSALPEIRIIYGGVYPSYAYREIMREAPELDVIVRGEGEATISELIPALESGADLDGINGIVWRRGAEVVFNPPRAIIQNLDEYRPAWELVDWKNYRMFGFANVAGFQFSRGCPLTCSYCGQWLFWKKWRHRSPENMVSQLKLLKERYGVTMVWFADENFAADRDTTEKLLKLIVDADLNLSLNINMTAADVVRDADIIPLYKSAGVDYVVMGIESLKDSVISDVRKNNPFVVSKEAVRLLRENHILSLTNLIYGLEEESWRTLFEKFKGLLELDSDILNAVYLMPHFWTLDGRKNDSSKIIQKDLSKWSYRNQIIAVDALSPFQLFLGVKLTEAIFHLRLRSLLRLVASPDKNYLKIFRHSIWAGIKVWVAEVIEYITQVRFSPRGTTERIPGQPDGAVEYSPLELQ